LLFNISCKTKENIAEVVSAYDFSRKQYRASIIIKELQRDVPPDAIKIIGITSVDLFEPALTFVFGAAQLGGISALVSFYRLRQEFYGLPGKLEVLLERLFKEINHELGHTFGLVHCSQVKCVMSLSLNIKQLDTKAQDFCPRCAELVKIELEKLQ
jgi:archaemetzincin